MRVLGVDGCREGWLGVAAGGGPGLVTARRAS